MSVLMYGAVHLYIRVISSAYLFHIVKHLVLLTAAGRRVVY